MAKALVPAPSRVNLSLFGEVHPARGEYLCLPNQLTSFVCQRRGVVTWLRYGLRSACSGCAADLLPSRLKAVSIDRQAGPVTLEGSCSCRLS